MEHVVYLTIENDVCSATATVIEHPHHYLYHVVFEDGYENMFFTSVETGVWIEEDLGETDLAAAVGSKLMQVLEPESRPLKPLSWCRATIADMAINFGFYTYVENTHTVFEVYTDNQKFLCNLVKNNKGCWVMYGSRRRELEYQYTNQLHVIISLFEGMADKN